MSLVKKICKKFKIYRGILNFRRYLYIEGNFFAIFAQKSQQYSTDKPY